MRSPVGAVLDRAGLRLSEAEFARLLADVLGELGPAADDEPRGTLSAAEQAALDAIGADLAPRRAHENDPRAGAAAAYAGLLADALTVNELAHRLGIDTSRVRHRLKARRLVGIRRPDGWRLPSYQFGADGRPLPGLDRVARAVPADAHPVAVWRFLDTPQPELRVDGAPVSPREWLAGGGDPAPVAALAADLHALP